MDFQIVSAIKIQNAWRCIYNKSQAYRLFRFYVVAREAAHYGKMRINYLNYIETNAIIIQSYTRRLLAYINSQNRITKLLQNKDDHYVRFISSIANSIDYAFSIDSY